MKTELHLVLPGGKRRYVISTGPLASEPASWVAYLLVCTRSSDLKSAERFVQDALSAGCRFIVCVGPMASQLEHEIDYFLEARGEYDVVTTSHEGKDALEEAIVVVEGGLAPTGIVRVLCEDPSSVERTLHSMGLI